MMPFVLVELRRFCPVPVHLYYIKKEFVCVARPASVSEVRDSPEGNILLMSD